MWTPDEETKKLEGRYAALFGKRSLGCFSNFTQTRDEVMLVIRRALERGSPATDEEIAWLNRFVRDDVDY